MIREALAGARRAPGPPQRFALEILDHEVSLRGPQWHALTRFQATLSEDGRTIRTWDASGDDERWNVLSAYIDADNAAKEGFREAVKDLVAKLLAYRPARP